MATTAFLPLPPILDISAHETLLTRLGLWEFLNLDMNKTIPQDLISEVVGSYNYYPMKFTGESRVNDVSISLNRTAVAKALHLPVERAAKGWSFPVSEEERSFLEKLIWGHLILRNASVLLDKFILEFFEGLKELRLGNADWAGLLWFMMERELLQVQRKNSASCYYASYLQLVLMHQRPELFDEGGGDSAVSVELLLDLQTDVPQPDGVPEARLILLKKIKDQNEIIQQYELLLQQERQQTEQTNAILQKERDMYDRQQERRMAVIESYKKALTEINTSLATYRERAQLSGVGDISEGQKAAIKAMLEEFEQEWMGKMEECLAIFDRYCGMLRNLGDQVRKISARS